MAVVIPVHVHVQLLSLHASSAAANGTRQAILLHSKRCSAAAALLWTGTRAQQTATARLIQFQVLGVGGAHARLRTLQGRA